MSIIVTSNIGRFRKVNTNDPAHPDTWLFECPGCGQWAYLDEDQWNGRVSVDHASDGCVGCYHQTHNFGAALVAAMQARILAGTKPYDDEPAETTRTEPKEPTTP